MKGKWEDVADLSLHCISSYYEIEYYPNTHSILPYLPPYPDIIRRQDTKTIISVTFFIICDCLVDEHHFEPTATTVIVLSCSVIPHFLNCPFLNYRKKMQKQRDGG